MSRDLVSSLESSSLRGGQTLAGLRPWFPRSFAAADRVAGLERIFDGAMSVCIWRRPVNQAIDTYLKEAMPGLGEDRIARVSRLHPGFDDLLWGFAPRPDSAAFLSELHRLLHGYELFPHATTAELITDAA